MQVTSTDLSKHATRINAILQKVCDAPAPAPFVTLTDGLIHLAKSCPSTLCREVTTDLGSRELALRLPVPNTNNPRFWTAIQERWEYTSKHRLTFLHCGLRLYVGDKQEEALQFVRLEWIAPTCDHNGIQSYKGAHAAHPHWHVDRAALFGEEDYFRSLEALTAPKTAPEEFTSSVVAAPSRLDFSWLQNIHLPARAQWMQSEWDGQQVPGPHQCEPSTLDELTRWWAGALKYIIAELPH